MFILYSAQPAEESIDDVTPFSGVEALFLHALFDFFPVFFRKVQVLQGLLHFQHFFVSFKMIVIDALNQRPAVFHAEAVGQPVEEEKQPVGAAFPVFIEAAELFRILPRKAGAFYCAVDPDTLAVSPVMRGAVYFS